MRGTIDSNGNITGELDLTVSFANATYQIEWQGAYDGSRITGSTESSATLGSFDIDYTLSFTAE